MHMRTVQMHMLIHGIQPPNNCNLAPIWIRILSELVSICVYIQSQLHLSDFETTPAFDLQFPTAFEKVNAPVESLKWDGIAIGQAYSISKFDD